MYPKNSIKLIFAFIFSVSGVPAEYPAFLSGNSTNVNTLILAKRRYSILFSFQATEIAVVGTRTQKLS